MSSGARRKRADDAGPMETVVENLAHQVNALSAQLTSQQTSFNAQLTLLNAQLASLNAQLTQVKAKADKLDQTVAFHAWHTSNPIHATAGGILVLDHAETNLGNGYNPRTGVFTVPQSGLYHFQATIMSYNRGPGGEAQAGLYVDNQQLAHGVSDSELGQHDQASIAGTVHVRVGQEVFVKNWGSSAEDYYGAEITTFSGFLLHAD